ncbi:HDOD domain-containing protein [Desulfurobacterium thermolithotrophum]|uniref:HDOD domain-containing protein n=1 Tax=Desulfurobacterium thermolithotrophum TaxID=64160 RepID=UPI0013D4232F|nr:HDOD domain-containing protein [Desulfurobacterium thermolithotrophum]
MFGFRFGKRKRNLNKSQETHKEEKIKINRRMNDRYIVDLGNIVNISKTGCRIKKQNPEELKKEFIEVQIGKEKLKSIVVEDKASYYSVKFLKPLQDSKLIKSKVKRLKEFKLDKEKEKIDFDKLEAQSSEFKAIINLLSEINNPNTDTEKLTGYIIQIPKVKKAILEVANSAESGTAERINSLTTAIARIGFEKLKEVIRTTIMKDLSFENKDFSEFEHFEAYNLLKSTFLTEILRYVTFKDSKNEARLLFTSETTPLTFFTKLNNSFVKYYTSVKRMYSPYSRYLERKNFGTDFLELSKEFIVEYSGLFKYLYDGYILAHLNLFPFLTFPKRMKISISKRKLDFSYVTYLALTAVLAIIGKDRKKTHILVNRLKRLGMDTNKVMEFLNTVIENTNDALYNMGLRRSVRVLPFSVQTIKLSKIFPKDNIYFDYIVNAIASSKGRIAFRHEDRIFSGYILDFVLNVEDFDFNTKSFCIIPCENLLEDELNIEDFSGFDIIVFKDFDLLSKKLFKDFKEIWQKFEGTIICTYSTYSFMDWDRPDLYNLVKGSIVDLPTFLYNTKSYEFIQERIKEDLKDLLGSLSFNEELVFKEETIESIIYSYMETVSI